MIKVFIVDDQPAARDGLRMWLNLAEDVTVVGEAGDGASAISLVPASTPDIVLMDVAMPGMDGISTTRCLRALTPRTAVIMVSLYDDVETRTGATSAGAVEFVPKHQVDQTLLDTIRRVAAKAA
jgi:DNA-binding NarL/FixJ family response regulator